MKSIEELSKEIKISTQQKSDIVEWGDLYFARTRELEELEGSINAMLNYLENSANVGLNKHLGRNPLIISNVKLFVKSWKKEFGIE